MMAFTALLHRRSLPGRAVPAVAAALAFALLLPDGDTRAQTRELSSTGELLDGVAAVVNDDVVLKSELQESLDRIVSRLREQGTPLPPTGTLIQQVLERLVIERIQIQRADRLGMEVSDEMLNQALANIAARNNVSLSDLPDLLASEGVDYGAYRRELRQQILLDQLRQRDVIARISVSPKEIDSYLARQAGQAGLRQEYRLSHILIALSPGATSDEIEAARQRIEDIHRRVTDGEDFAKLAVSYSDGQQALEGGGLGWLKGSELPSLFADVVPGLEPGDTSGPIRNNSGFHLVRLDEKRGSQQIMENQTRARHILITTNEVLDDAAARQKLADLRQRILDGEDFASVARVVSEDPQSAVDGGDLGWSAPGSYVPEFEQALAELEPGALSEPFRTSYGWHIAEVLERRVHDATADRQRQEAVMAIRNSKLGEEVEVWTRRLRDEAFVEYRL